MPADPQTRGFATLDLLIGLVVAGALLVGTAVGVAGAIGEHDERSECETAAELLAANSIVHYARRGAYPTTFTQLDERELLALPDGIDVATVSDGSRLDGDGWTMSIDGTGVTPPVLTCA